MTSRTHRVMMWFLAGLVVAAPEPVPPESSTSGRSHELRASPPGNLFAAWRSGDRRAGNLLFQRYSEQLGELLRRTTGRIDVEDTVQEVLLAALSDRRACLSSLSFEKALLDEVDRVTARDGQPLRQA
ncbi:MAG: hypothetical protein IAG13_15995 [Deltaproteobacteria bacterium]|nr:hypothetical protein [Nannocystaceae bacterium]